MNTKPNLSRFADVDNVKIPPNTLAKAEAEGDSFSFTRISAGHYACDSGDAIHIIIKKDGQIGCSCGDMTYRCTGNAVCKHITTFLKLEVPPQTPASGELIKKLILMGWVGGKDDLHPPELLRRPGSPPEPTVAESATVEMVHYECPKCGEAADIDADKLNDWKLDHMQTCPGTRANGKPQPPQQDPEIRPVEDVGAVAPLVPGIYESNTPDEPEQKSTISKTEIVETPEPEPVMVPTNLATALCNMQKIDLLAVTDSNNPFHNAKYADLASVWAAIRKPLTDNGLAVIQTTEQYPDGITVVTTLLHTSGESFTARLSCEVPKSKPDKNGMAKPNIQGLGSTITYLRRYSLAAMVGVAPVDDDGEAAMGRT